MLSNKIFKQCCIQLLILIFIFYSTLVWAESKRPELPKIYDLRNTAKLSQQKQIPILVMFGTDECPFCERLREEFLIPMIISGDYTDKVILREVHLGYNNYLIDFSGKKISTNQLAHRYGVRLFPTTILIDSHGKQLVESILGITTPSLFGGTLDDSIDKALLLLN